MSPRYSLLILIGDSSRIPMFLNVHVYLTSHPPLLKEPQTVTTNFPSKPFTLSSTISFSWTISARGIRCSNSWKYLCTYMCRVSGRLLHMRHMQHSQSKLVGWQSSRITCMDRAFFMQTTQRDIILSSTCTQTDRHHVRGMQYHNEPWIATSNTHRKSNGRAYVWHLTPMRWWWFSFSGDFCKSSKVVKPSSANFLAAAGLTSIIQAEIDKKENLSEYKPLPGQMAATPITLLWS